MTSPENSLNNATMHGQKRRPGRPPSRPQAVAASAELSDRDLGDETDEFDQGAPVHASRDQEYPSDEPLHEDDDGDWSPPSLLEAPPPRPGFVQRWVRTRRGSVDDISNLAKARREGWTPRRPDSISGGFTPPTDAHGNLGSVVMVDGMVLMEMSVRRNEQRQAFYQRKLARQTEAIDQQLLKVQQPGHPIDRRAESRVTVGQRRRPVVQQDEDAA